MFSDPVNFIDPNGKFAWNVFGTIVGAAYDGYKAAVNGGSISQIMGAMLVGGASGFLKGGKVGFNVLFALYSNISAQIASPGFDGIDFSQAIMMAALSAAGLPDKYISKYLREGSLSFEIFKKVLLDLASGSENTIEKYLSNCKG